MIATARIAMACAAAVSATLVACADGAMLAADDASNYTTATWTNGSNQGTGFGAWVIPTNDANFNLAVESSSGNSGTPNIDVSSKAWRIRRVGSFNQVQRGFTAGGPNNAAALAPGQSFKFSIDWNAVNTSASVGLWLTDTGTGERWGLQYTGGTANLILKVNGGSNQDSGIPVTSLNNGANVTFNVLADGKWTASVEKLSSGGSTIHNLSSDTFGTLSASPTGFRYFVAANDGTRYMYLNNLQVVPEPSMLGLAALGALALPRRRRH
jgi:hypothetical protein